MGPASNQNDVHSRRIHERRENDVCIVAIGDRQYPVKDWSKGGICIETDSRTFGLGDEAAFKLKFRTTSKVVDIEHFANVVRKTKNEVAFKFAPTTQKLMSRFEDIIKDMDNVGATA